MGRKAWSKAEVVAAADLNTYLMDQSVMTFATAAARSSAITSPTQGMVTWRNDAAGPIKLEYYNGSSWVAITFSSPAQTVQGQSSTQTLTSASLTHSTAANTWSSWTSGGTSPSGTSYLTEVGMANLAGTSASTIFLFEFSLDGGTTTWKRSLNVTTSGNASMLSMPCTPRSAPTLSTVHWRFKCSAATSGSSITVSPVLTWTSTAPAITLSTAESLWESSVASTTYGTWTTLGTVGAAHRLVAVGSQTGTEGGLATGATPTVISRWKTCDFVPGHNRAVPSGSLKVSGTAALVYVLTEPV